MRSPEPRDREGPAVRPELARERAEASGRGRRSRITARPGSRVSGDEDLSRAPSTRGATRRWRSRARAGGRGHLRDGGGGAPRRGVDRHARPWRRCGGAAARRRRRSGVGLGVPRKSTAASGRGRARAGRVRCTGTRWLGKVGRWPPSMVRKMGDFLKLRDPSRGEGRTRDAFSSRGGTGSLLFVRRTSGATYSDSRRAPLARGRSSGRGLPPPPPPPPPLALVLAHPKKRNSATASRPPWRARVRSASGAS